MAELVSIKRNVDVSPGQAAPAVFHCSQGDVGSKIILGLLNNGTAYSIPSGVTVTIEGSESNGSIFTPISATASGSDITFYLTGEMTAVAGPAICQAVLKSGSNILGTANFTLEVESSPMGADAPPVFTDAGWTWMLNKLNTEFVPALGNETIIDAIDSKLDKNQGTANAGKYLKVGADGNVTAEETDKTLSITDKAADAKAVGDELTGLKADFDATVIPWNAIESNTIAKKTYDNAGAMSTNNTYYTVLNIPVEPGQTWYAYSIYSHASSVYNHKVRKVNFYNNGSYVSSLDYVNQWVIPAEITSMNISMVYIGNNYDNGISQDDYITQYADGNHYNHLSDKIRLVDDNIPDGFVTDRMLENIGNESWNAISNNTILENTFIRTNGQIVASNSFYTVNGIEVTYGQVWYAFCAYNTYARFVTFYNSSNTAIGGYEYIKSWTIPENAVKMSVTLNYTDGTKSSRDYITSQMFEIIQEIQNEDKKYGNRETRICTINFQFDDGDVKDADIFTIFNNNGVPCGFALISNVSTSRVPEYLMYQRNGFEILSHSTDSTGMSSASLDPSEVNTKLQNSRKVLEGYGFVVRGWVTPYSEMNDAFIPLMQRYYDFGTTVYYGEYDGTGTPYRTFNDETVKLFRVSLQSTTLENQKKAVDEAIANNGFLTFYGHSADLDGTDNETTANLNSLLSYINSKVSQLQCIVLKPSDAVDYYFHVRHSDYLNLIN